MQIVVQMLKYIFPCFILISCGNNENGSLIGTWVNESLEVDITSFKGEVGKDSILSIKVNEWESKLKIQPIHTTYSEDGSWESNYFNINGEQVFKTQGKWWSRSDTLFMHQQSPKDELNYYFFTVNGNRANFTTTIDWDSDGEADDEYNGWQKRMKN